MIGPALLAAVAAAAVPALFGAPAPEPTPSIPPISLDLTGCWEMGASNGKAPTAGCGTAPLDTGDGLVYLLQSPGGAASSAAAAAVTACLSQSVCYRPATGQLANTSSGAGMLRLRTLTGSSGVGNCTAPRFPADGLLEHFNWVLPAGWPSNGTQTRGTNVPAADLSGTFVNDASSAGVAGGIFLRRSADPAACDHMRALPDCTAVPHASNAVSRWTPAASCEVVMQLDCGNERGTGRPCMECLEMPAHHASIRRAGCTPPDVQVFCGGPPRPPPPVPPVPPGPVPPETSRNVTGCYAFGGSAGHAPGPGCGMSPANRNGHAFVSHMPDGSVRVCLNQFCSRRLAGTLTTASNGVEFMTLATDFDIGNCTRAVSKNFPEAGLFAQIDFVVPKGWPESGAKTKGTHTNGTHALTGMFVNNGPALAGFLMMDPDVDPGECDRLHELPFCAEFVPSKADRESG